MYILTRSGLHFNFINPDPASVNAADVAYALSAINRFTGHTRYPFSVAQHSLAVAAYLEKTGASPERQLAGLLHDAHEAYFGDISAPLKAALGVAAHESRIQAVVAEAFGLSVAQLTHPLVKQADMVALAVERDRLMPLDATEWPCLAGVTPEMMAQMPRPKKEAPSRVAIRFLQQLDMLRTEAQIRIAG